MKLAGPASIVLVLVALAGAFALGRATITEPASAAPTNAQLNALLTIHRDLLTIQTQLGSGTGHSTYRELVQICRFNASSAAEDATC